MHIKSYRIRFLYRSHFPLSNNPKRTSYYLYKEFAQEDREIAEIGIADYAQQLRREDQL
jgi:hypothetical protein